MKSTINRLTDGTIELTITVPWIDVGKKYNEVVEETVKNTEVAGFRKGKAPRAVVEEKLDKTKVYEDVLKVLIPEVYDQAVREHQLHPIVSPKIELKEATEKKDWILRALTCERPSITLGAYKKAISDLKTSKAKKIWVPGQDVVKKPGEKPESEQGPQKPSLDEILKALYDTVTTTIPALLVEHEVNRLLSDLIDQTRKLGMSIEQYLSSTGRTSESVRKEYDEQSRRTLTLEFALEEVADKEGILISDDDIDTVIKTAKTDQEKKTLEAQRYYIASVLRRQKTIDFLAAV
ncbi:MAG TPA: trigger factor [Patescibacteria group bacterium]|jgi:trigger factor|nr:trigger factor [Patescibacteria group bacterium]